MPSDMGKPKRRRPATSRKRRETLGLRACAWNHALWAALDAKGWSDSRFAREAKLSSGGASKVIYGDVEPGPAVMKFVQVQLDVDLELWGEPCPVRRRHHITKQAA